LSLLFNISNQIDSSLNINIFFQNIARITCRELGIKSCLFYLKDNNSFFFRGGYGFSDDFNPDILPGKLASFPRAAQSLEPQFSPRHTSSPQAKIIKDLNLTKILCVPLVAKDNLHGIMVIGTSAKNPDGIINNKDLILTIANHATGWIERSKLFEELKQTNRSLTETRDQLIQSSKLAAIGQLAGGVAHEINNPLQIILVKAQLSMRKIKKLNLDLKELQAIESETKRIAQIVKGLLDFSRQSSETRDFSLVDIPRVLQECIDLIRHQMEMQSIHIQSNIPADIPLVRGNANQLKQVFLNLCLNAQHAMEKGGLFSIALRITDKAVLIDFTDTGCGIKKEYLEKIFEPFFTTKPPGTGTGLGLSVSYGVIEKHGGRINVKSEMNKGSTFTVELPANGADEESAG
ncbi:MAG: ATP-binding protein, partial [bacterium]